MVPIMGWQLATNTEVVYIRVSDHVHYVGSNGPLQPKLHSRFGDRRYQDGPELNPGPPWQR